MEAYRSEEDIIRIQICMHTFHQDCLQKWLKAKVRDVHLKCPLCNQIIELQKLKQLKDAGAAKQPAAPDQDKAEV